ncbi:MAG: BBP7 family outer membrane beta-barrel protein, partial [Planctomycetes bacterium]|nr:BBP7 family outer membrane beta-barrel protein [Planctomycetota bacterium]
IHSDIKVWGYEVNVVAHSIRTADRSVDLLLGFRSLRMTENLAVNQVITAAQDANFTIQFPTVGLGQNFYYDALAGSPVFVTDVFGTRNQFYGGQAGARFSWDFGRLSAELSGKVALGVTHQQVTIDGSTLALQAIDPKTLPLPTVTGALKTPGGMYSAVSNIGNYAQNQFTVVPEIGFSLKYDIARWLNVQLGYSGMYWSNVVRPGAQIDSTINTKLVPTGAFLPTLQVPDGSFRADKEQGRPFFNFRDTAFWAHGVHFGMEFRY